MSCYDPSVYLSLQVRTVGVKGRENWALRKDLSFSPINQTEYDSGLVEALGLL